MHHHVQEVSVWVWILKWKYYRVDLEDSRKGWILLFFWHFSFYLFAPATYIIQTHRCCQSDDRISRVHTQNCCLSRVFFIFETGFACSLNGNIMVDPFTLLLEQV